MAKLAIQLYTVRDLIHSGEDLLAILPKIKEMGFDGVEFAGFYGVDAKTLKAKLVEVGLVPVGCHNGMGDYQGEKLAETAAYVKELGLLYAGTGGAAHGTVAECEEIADIFSKAEPVLGIPTYYHNHTEEFTPLENGRIAMDIIADGTNLEIDTYWSFAAGVDNYKFITENKDKIILIHMKDGIDRHPKALIEGDCDLDAVVRAVKDTGLEWVILENDDPEPDGLSDAARSMVYLKKAFC